MSPIALQTDPMIERVAIIGAGPCGLAGAKYLVAEKKFSKIEVFEQRAKPGGVWNYNTAAEALDAVDGVGVGGGDGCRFAVPRTQPTGKSDTAIWTKTTSSGAGSPFADGGGDGDGDSAAAATTAAGVEPHFISPIYDHLETNIPHTLMNYTDAAFPAGCPLFPPHQVVRAYLQTYAKDLRPILSLQTQVLGVTPAASSGGGGGGGGWDVRVLDLRTEQERTSRFDAVLVASGHYNDPFVPEIRGLAEFDRANPGVILHSKFYRRPDLYAGKKVIIVGYSASGVDLSAQIAAVCQLPIIISNKAKPKPMCGPRVTTNKEDENEAGEESRVKMVPEIREFLPETRGVVYVDGTTDSAVDAVIFCTGYFYSFPFLKLGSEAAVVPPVDMEIQSSAPSSGSSSSPASRRDDENDNNDDPASASPLLPPIITDGSHAAHLYQHVLYTHDPTLAFVGIPQRVVPFPVSEAQAGWVARIWSGRLPTPSLASMQAWEAELVASKTKPASGPSSSRAALHNMAFPQDVEYINHLHDESALAKPAAGLDNGGHGKIPPYWGADKAWVRERMPLVKIASRALGSKRHEVRSLEELGFDFVAWKKQETEAVERLRTETEAEAQLI